MKKIVSMAMAAAVVASLAVPASAATVVVHEQNAWETQNQIEHGFGRCGAEHTVCGHLNNMVGGRAIASAMVRKSAEQVKVLSITEGVGQTWTKCDQAITIKEMKAVCEANDDINNLTVFRQRNVVNAEGAVELSVKLWPCAPDKHSNQATVVLFRAEGESEWTVVGTAKDKVCDVVLPGNGAYVVAMAW